MIASATSCDESSSESTNIPASSVLAIEKTPKECATAVI